MRAPRARYVYRIVAKGRVDPDRSSTQGRFHHSEPTSYAAGAVSTAWAEVSARFGGITPNVDAFELRRIELEGLKLVDLTDADVRSRYGIAADELQQTPAPRLCLEVARQIRAEGHDGAAYESAQVPGAVCYVLFLENIGGRLEAEPAEDEWNAFAGDLPP